jgi:hypothetical protein
MRIFILKGFGYGFKSYFDFTLQFGTNRIIALCLISKLGRDYNLVIPFLDRCWLSRKIFIFDSSSIFLSNLI